MWVALSSIDKIFFRKLLTMNCNFTITVPRRASRAGEYLEKGAHNAPESAVHDIKHGKKPHAGNKTALYGTFP
jgi:hypothetical protein